MPRGVPRQPLPPKELEDILRARLSEGLSWRKLLRISPRVRRSDLEQLRDSVIARGNLPVERFNNLPGSFQPPLGVLHHLLCHMNRLGAWRDVPQGVEREAVIKLFADGSQVYSRSFTECGWSPIFPEVPCHHSFDHHYMFALVDEKESLAVVREIFENLQLDEDIRSLGTVIFKVPTGYVNVNVRLVFDWWLHVYTNPGLSEPTSCGEEDIICYRCPFTGKEKNCWQYQSHPRHIEFNLGQDVRLPSVAIEHRIYDPLHANPRQLSAVALCICKVLEEMEHPVLP